MSLLALLPSWIEILSLTICTGAVLGAGWLTSTPDSPPLLWRDNNLGKVFGIGIGAAFLSAALAFLVRSTEMGDVPLSEVVPMLPAVLRSHYGQLWLGRMVALALLSGTALAARRLEQRGSLSWVMMALIAVVCGTESATGHAADAGDFTLPEFMDGLHLMAVLIWCGGLIALDRAVLRDATEEVAPRVAEAVSRFSRVAGWAVLVVAATAAYNTVINLDEVSSLMTTLYGGIVVGKGALFCALLEVGAFNRYLVVPALRESAGLDPLRSTLIGPIAAAVAGANPSLVGKGTVVRRFRATVRIEILLLVVMLLLATVLRHETPAKYAKHDHLPAVGSVEHHAH
ncbi:copper resistance D family protein [Geomesophilobacter sediminis]|uniref:CopD family protein n=1 Tax=Geomesophilobacter sediminis TaxID=2798584 RepID=A0A8J7IP98_9BACT|nr:CopD family protein [Geomesophilobacter sediminis]MBJ6725328.1 CopD family protein [Geomesophilobacter sediminis]